MKLSVEVLNTFLNYLLSTSMVTGTNLSSKTPGSDLEDRLVPESPEVDANLSVNVFKTYTDSFIQF